MKYCTKQIIYQISLLFRGRY